LPGARYLEEQALNDLFFVFLFVLFSIEKNTLKSQK
jgi:hypothetical protein